MKFFAAKLFVSRSIRPAVAGSLDDRQQLTRSIVIRLRRHVSHIAAVCSMVCMPLVAGAQTAAPRTAPAAVDSKGQPGKPVVPPSLSSPGLPGWGPHGKPLYYFMVFSNATPGADAEFNKWYDRIHAPVVIESGDFVWAQRFQLSPVQLAGGALVERQYLVIFAIETDDIIKTAAEATRRVGLPRNVRSKALDYSNLVSVTMEALGPPITQKEAQARLAEEEALGHVPPAEAIKNH